MTEDQKLSVGDTVRERDENWVRLGIVTATRMNGEQQLVSGYWHGGERFDNVLTLSLEKAGNPMDEITRLRRDLADVRESYTLTSRTLGTTQEQVQLQIDYNRRLKERLDRKLGTENDRRWALKVTGGDPEAAEAALSYLNQGVETTNWYMPAGQSSPPVTEPPTPDAKPLDKDVLIQSLIVSFEEAVAAKQHECCEIVNEALTRDMPGMKDLFDTVMSRSMSEDVGTVIVGKFKDLFPNGADEMLRQDGISFRRGDKVVILDETAKLNGFVSGEIMTIDPTREDDEGDSILVSNGQFMMWLKPTALTKVP